LTIDYSLSNVYSPVSAEMRPGLNGVSELFLYFGGGFAAAEIQKSE
jgi:hypothetical protein